MTERSAITDAIRTGKARIGDVESATRARLAARYAATWARVESELQFVDMLVEAERAGPWFTDDGKLTRFGEVAFRQQRLDDLLSLIEAEYGRTANVALSDLTTAQQQAIGIGTQTATSMGLEGSMGAALNTEAYERIIAATDPGSPLHGVLSRYGDEAKQAIETHLIDGMIQGKGMQDIVMEIQAVIGEGVPEWKLASLARTESMRAFRGSLQTAYTQMGVKQVRWTAALSPRSCLACISRNGQIFPVDFEMDSHVNCRCIMSPVTGEPTTRMTGEEWFARQPADVQRRMMPSDDALDAYRNGDVTLSDFVGRTRSRVWGPSIYQRSASAVLSGSR